MPRRLVHFLAVALRWLAIALLLAIPVGSGIAYAVGLAKDEYMEVLRWNSVTETSLDYAVSHGEIIFKFTGEWAGTPPQDGNLCSLPGFNVSRHLGLTMATFHEKMLLFRVRWWLLLLANIPPLLLALRLAWPMLRRRPAPGRCPVCGYDLRASPERCPECGTKAANENATAQIERK